MSNDFGYEVLQQLGGKTLREATYYKSYSAGVSSATLRLVNGAGNEGINRIDIIGAGTNHTLIFKHEVNAVGKRQGMVMQKGEDIATDVINSVTNVPLLSLKAECESATGLKF